VRDGVGGRALIPEPWCSRIWLKGLPWEPSATPNLDVLSTRAMPSSCPKCCMSFWMHTTHSLEVHCDVGSCLEHKVESGFSGSPRYRSIQGIDGGMLGF
jgi:hypothetical protein